MMARLGFGSLAALVCAIDLVAQTSGAVGGSVTIADVEEGFPGALISIEGLALATFTDAEGRFSFDSVPVGSHRVRAEVIGCSPGSWTVEVSAGVVAHVEVTAEGSAFEGSGPFSVASRTSPRTDEPFAIDRLGPDDLRDDPARSVADLLRGAFAGVKVVQGSGLPGEGLSIQFRGPGSISGSEDPLVVVDGMITGGGLDDISPRDIESIKILKGATGSATYGSRGAAGVIEITTFRGLPEEVGACTLRVRPSS